VVDLLCKGQDQGIAELQFLTAVVVQILQAMIQETIVELKMNIMLGQDQVSPQTLELVLVMLLPLPDLGQIRIIMVLM
jgi:hypothetical protein